MANNVEPDEMAHNESSHLDLHCLQRHLYWSARVKGVNARQAWAVFTLEQVWYSSIWILLPYIGQLFHIQVPCFTFL